MKKSLNFNVLKKTPRVRLREGYADGSFLSLLMDEYDDERRTLKAIASLSSTLNVLADFVEKGLTRAREQLLPKIYNRGIYSLPFEVIADIIMFLHGEEDSYQWRNILLVNRYFRDICLRIPSLWTKVDNRQNPRLLLERSGSRGLYVTIKGLLRTDKKQLRRFLELLEPHTSRWKTLSFTVPQGRYIDSPQSNISLALRSLRDEFQGRVFPILETLRIDYKYDAPLDEDGLTVIDNEHDPNVTPRSFFSTWDMPSLRCVDATGFIPVLPPGCLNNLTCLRFSLHGSRKEEGSSIIWDLQMITLFLRSLGALEELSIRLFTIDDFSNEGVPFELPRLQTLSITLFDSYNTPIAELFSVLSAPNTKRLTLSIYSYDKEDAYLALEVLFPRSEPRWPLLQLLDICVENGKDLGASEFSLSVLSRLPRLHHLTIRAADFVPPERLALHQFYRERGAHEHPPLRSLHLLYCDEFDMEFVSTLRPIFDAPEFEILEIINCLKIPMEEVRSILPEGKKLKFE